MIRGLDCHRVHTADQRMGITINQLLLSWLSHSCRGATAGIWDWTQGFDFLSEGCRVTEARNTFPGEGGHTGRPHRLGLCTDRAGNVPVAFRKQQHLYKAPTPLPAADSVVVHGPLPPAAAGWVQRGEGWKKKIHTARAQQNCIQLDLRF